MKVVPSSGELNTSTWPPCCSIMRWLVASPRAMHTGGTGLLVMDGQGEKVGDGFKAAPRAPGRGELAYRRAGHQMIQVALPPARDSTQTPDTGGRQDW